MPKRERDNASTHGKVLSGPTTNISQKIHTADLRLFTGVKRACVDTESSGMPGCKRSDLLLSANYSKRPVAGSQHVISIDGLEFDKVDGTNVSLNGLLYKVYLPMDLAQFQCDVYDARDHLELALALAQVSIIEYRRNGAAGVNVYSPDNRCFCTDNEYKKPDGANNIVLRRNVIVIDPDKKISGNTEKEIQNELMKMFADCPHSSHMTFVHMQRTFDVDAILNLCKQKPQCSVMKQTMEAPIASYAGVAMTDAFYNASNGDTFVTSNMYSLMTTQNGPVPSCHGDTLHWLWNVEQYYYNKHGCRFARNLWYDKANNDLIFVHNVENPLQFDKQNYRDGAAESRIGRKFHFIPFKMGYDEGMMLTRAPRYGLLDSMNQRRVGVAQSNAGAYASIDITNCGKCIN